MARAPPSCALREGEPQRIWAPGLTARDPEGGGTRSSSSPVTSSLHPTSIHASTRSFIRSAFIQYLCPPPTRIQGTPKVRRGPLGRFGNQRAGVDPYATSARRLTSLMRMVAQVGHRVETTPAPLPAMLWAPPEQRAPSDARKPCPLISRFSRPLRLCFVRTYLSPPKTETGGEDRRGQPGGPTNSTNIYQAECEATNL